MTKRRLGDALEAGRLTLGDTPKRPQGRRTLAAPVGGGGGGVARLAARKQAAPGRETAPRLPPSRRLVPR